MFIFITFAPQYFIWDVFSVYDENEAHVLYQIFNFPRSDVTDKKADKYTFSLSFILFYILKFK